VTERSEGANTPENFQLRWACRCLMESSIGRRQSVFRMQQEPHGSCGSLRRSAGSWTGETPWGAGSKRYGSPSRGGLKRVRGKRGRKPLRRSGKHVLRRGLRGPGTTAVEPGRTGSSAFESVELSTSSSSEFEVVEHHGRESAVGTAR